MSRYENLYRTIDEIKPKTILEVGTHAGITAAGMIIRAKIHNTDIEYYGFDLWEDLTPEQKKREHCGKRIATYIEAVRNTRIVGCTTQLYQGDTLQTLLMFSVLNERIIDFAFIDGGHHIDTIKADWENVRRVMKKGGIVIFDDFYYWSTDRENLNIGCNTLINVLINDYPNMTFFPERDSDPNNPDYKIGMVKVVI